MKTCTVCEKELLTSLDEYGPAKEPVCFTHFMTGEIVLSDEERDTAKSTIELLEAELEDIAGEIELLEDQKNNLEDKLEEAEAELEGQGKVVVITQRQITAWKQGWPKTVKDIPYAPDRAPLLFLNQ